MKILGVDFGEKRIGLAVSFGGVVETRPYLFVFSQKKALEAIFSLCQREKIERVIVGISEGETARKTVVFAKALKKMVNLPVVLFDETLTTKEAVEKFGRRNKKKIDSVSAALVLERYLEANSFNVI